ncbi:MAG: c-type cytochrome [Chloroflexi bacterium]|nr:c-type cytochrome [Chloroflexota bacterium]
MRIKTLGVLLVTVLAAFTMLYWFTDEPRRAAIAAEHDAELLHFGEVVFSNNPDEPAAAGCARCHGDDGKGGPIPNDPNGRQAPSLHTASLAAKLKVNPAYVHLAVAYGGVVVSGNVNSPMPAWSAEVGGPLNVQQIDAVVTLVTGWAEAAANEAPIEVPDTPEAGAQVFASAGCGGCHGVNLEGGVGPALTNIGNEIGTGLPTEISGLEQLKADYKADPRKALEQWIRDSATNYNGGTATGMPPHPPEVLSDNQLKALITFLLTQTAGG